MPAETPCPPSVVGWLVLASVTFVGLVVIAWAVVLFAFAVFVGVPLALMYCTWLLKGGRANNVGRSGYCTYTCA